MSQASATPDHADAQPGRYLPGPRRRPLISNSSTQRIRTGPPDRSEPASDHDSRQVRIADPTVLGWLAEDLRPRTIGPPSPRINFNQCQASAKATQYAQRPTTLKQLGQLP